MRSTAFPQNGVSFKTGASVCFAVSNYPLLGGDSTRRPGALTAAVAEFSYLVENTQGKEDQLPGC